MKADRQCELRPKCGEPPDARNHPGRRYDDVPGTQGELARVRQDLNGLEDPVEVEQRLAHAHEDDVGQVAAAPRQAPGGMANLIDDLGRFQVAAEAQLSGGAERAADRAAGLAGDAQRVSLAVKRPSRPGIATRRIVHQHRFDERAVEQEVERLLSVTAVGDLDFVLDDRVDAERLVDPSLQRGGQRLQLAGSGGVLAPHGIADLLGPECRLAFGLQPFLEIPKRQATEPGAFTRGSPGIAARSTCRHGLLGSSDGIVAGSRVCRRIGRAHRAAIIARARRLAP